MSSMQGNSQTYFAEHQEESFLKYLGDVFQFSLADRKETSSSKYSYFLLKPYPKPGQRFGLHGEILALYAPYGEVQARSIIDAQNLQVDFKERVHPVWNILITDDPNTRENLDKLTAGKDLETYSIPFSRSELEAKPQAEFIYERIEQYLKGRDLFAFQSALQSDTFFFGRKDVVDGLIAQIENGQNFGLFGLRKTGKTSVLNAVERYLEKFGNYKVIRLDCQNPSVYLMRWNSLINRICTDIESKDASTYKGILDPVERLERLVKASRQRIVLIFDEIENLGFDLSLANHWKEDFLHFWGAIRAIHQTSRGQLTFGVAGVNPHIFEVPLVMGKDNPVLLGVDPLYLSPLDKNSTREMVKTISGFMNLDFEEKIYDWLFAQYGGLPLMTRKACSLVTHKDGQRLANSQIVSVSDFHNRRDWLDEQLGRDIVSMLVVLAQHYPDEFDNLLLLANHDQGWLLAMKQHVPETLRHILSYGIIQEDRNTFKFAIGTLDRVLQRDGETMKAAVKELSASSNPTSYESIPENNQLDRWARLTRIRNQVEPALRKLTYRALLYRYGDKKSLMTVLDKFSPEKQKALMGYSLQQIFTGESKALYLKDLKEIILRDWSLFEGIFGDKKAFEIRVDRINTDGRKDAHSTPNDEDEVLQTEATGRELLEQMAPFLQQ